MKKYLLAGIVLGTTAYAIRTTFKLGVYVGELRMGLQLLNDAEEMHPKGMNKHYEHE